jgi:signal transduction histidine kinase
VVDLARAVVDDLHPNASARGIDIVAGSEVTNVPRLGGDAFLLVAALQNLVENPITASPGKGTVDVTLASSDGQLLCAVSDRGPGIAEGDRAGVANRFYRVRPALEGGLQRPRPRHRRHGDGAAGRFFHPDRA